MINRPNTPDVPNDDGSTTCTYKRACNGCHRVIGDLTDDEIDAVFNHEPLPDVRAECGCGGAA